jgi:hypothetical protein
MYVDAESLINLTCVVGNTMHLNNNIIWQFNNQVFLKASGKLIFIFYKILYSQEINYDSKRGGLSIVVHKEFNMTISELLIQGAKKADSGIYTCYPTFSNPATIRLNVINGKFDKIKIIIMLSNVMYVCM